MRQSIAVIILLTLLLGLAAPTAAQDASPGAEVSVDGKTVGRTPIANLPLALGEHEFTFRHPQLGDDRQKVIVKSDAITRVTANLHR